MDSLEVTVNDGDQTMLDADSSQSLCQNSSLNWSSQITLSMNQVRQDYRCKHCDFVTSVWPTFKAHSKLHSSSFFKCSLCEFCTPYKTNLERHNRNHVEKGEFQCGKCSFSSNIIRSLNYHTVNHHLESWDMNNRHSSNGSEGGLSDSMVTGDSKVNNGNVSNEKTRDMEMSSSGDAPDIPTVNLPSDVIIIPNNGTSVDDSPDIGDAFMSPSDLSGDKDEGNDEGVDKPARGMIRCSGIAKIFKDGSLVELNENIADCGDIIAKESDKGPSKRPLPCLIPLSKNAPTLTNNGVTLSSNKDGILSSGSVLDKLFTKRMTAANATENNTVGPDSPTKSTVGLVPSSTRCPYCRQRCKTTDGLRIHKKTCPQAPQMSEAACNIDNNHSFFHGKNTTDDDVEILSERRNSVETSFQLPIEKGFPHAPTSLPGTNVLPQTIKNHAIVLNSESPRQASSLVKRVVFQCPECAFWASTASRFHIHMVGHLNMRPYECSICSYRSNWRWDVTKHIRLKSSRDPLHLSARLRIRSEVKADNISDYNEYLVAKDVEKDLHCSLQNAPNSKRKQSVLLPAESRPLANGTSPDLSIIQQTGTLYGSGLGMTPVPRTSDTANLPPELSASSDFANVPDSTVRFPVVQGVFLPILPNEASSLTGSNLKYRKIMPASSTLKSTAADFTDKMPSPNSLATPSLESLKRMDPALAAMGLTSENTAIILPEPPPDLQQSSGSSSQSGGGGKPVIWRCKRCPFKHKEKRAMMAHVAQHFSNDNFFCGHCGLAAKSEITIRRHSRIKHPNVDPIVGRSSIGESYNAEVESSLTDSFSQLGEKMVCRLCTFTCAPGDNIKMADHIKSHVDGHPSRLSCNHCSFYATNERVMREHMVLHEAGVSRKSETLFNGINDQPQFEHYKDEVLQDASSPFRCHHCPFSTHNKTQLMSHRQYHALRQLHYSCPRCTFNVPQRAQLIEHAKLHGLRERKESTEVTVSGAVADKSDHEELVVCDELPAVQPAEEGKDEDGLVEYKWRLGVECSKPSSSVPPLADSATRDLTEIPLVWVWRGGRFFQMFKCRRCPHVNVRLVHIKSHEVMHGYRDPFYNRSCDRCDYVGVSSTVIDNHTLVHGGSLGHIYSVVDPLRPAEEQLAGFGCALSGSSKEAATVNTETHGGSRKEGVVRTPKRILFFCQQCPGRFFHEKEILIHSRFHGADFPYACTSCNYTARQAQHLQGHLKVHSGEYHTRSRSLLTTYQYSPSYPPAPCDTPDIAPTAAATAEAHESTAVNQDEYVAPPVPSKTGRRFPCNRCPAAFSKESSLMRHLPLHNSGNAFRCPYCDYAVKQSVNLNRHILLHQRTDQRPAVRKEEKVNTSAVNVTQQAPDTASDASASVKLTAATSPSKRYQCALCPAVLTKRDKYVRHVIKHTTRSRHRCSECSFVTKSYSVHVSHMASHGVSLPKFQSLEDISADNDEQVTVSDGDNSGLDNSSAAVKAVFCGTPEMSAVEKQQIVLEQLRNCTASSEKDADAQNRRSFCCEKCPYISHRRDHLEAHSWRHRHSFSRSGSSFLSCSYCDYVGAQGHLTRDHRRSHFRPRRHVKLDGYTRLDDVEVFSALLDQKVDKDCMDQEDVSSVFVEIDRKIHSCLYSDEKDQDQSSYTSSDDDNDDDDVEIIDMLTGYPVTATGNNVSTNVHTGTANSAVVSDATTNCIVDTNTSTATTTTEIDAAADKYHNIGSASEEICSSNGDTSATGNHGDQGNFQKNVVDKDCAVNSPVSVDDVETSSLIVKTASSPPCSNERSTDSGEKSLEADGSNVDNGVTINGNSDDIDDISLHNMSGDVMFGMDVDVDEVAVMSDVSTSSERQIEDLYDVMSSPVHVSGVKSGVVGCDMVSSDAVVSINSDK